MNKLLFLIFFGLFLSCNRDEDSSISELSVLTRLIGEGDMSFTDSLGKWGDLKTKNGNSYVYQTTFSSWAGFGSTTELRIENGKITQRVFEAYTIDSNTGNINITDSYTETVSDLGANEIGAALRTIDDLYSSCAGKYLIVDESKNTLYFQTEINGLMTLCGFVPNQCMDDCYQGITISAFEWID